MTKDAIEKKARELAERWRTEEPPYTTIEYTLAEMAEWAIWEYESEIQAARKEQPLPKRDLANHPDIAEGLTDDD